MRKQNTIRYHTGVLLASGRIRLLTWASLLLLASSAVVAAPPSAAKLQRVLDMIVPETAIEQLVRQGVEKQPDFAQMPPEAQRCGVRVLSRSMGELLQSKWLAQAFQSDAEIDQWLEFSETQVGKGFMTLFQDTILAVSRGEEPTFEWLAQLPDAEKLQIFEALQSPQAQRLMQGITMDLSEQETQQVASLVMKECGFEVSM